MNAKQKLLNKIEQINKLLNGTKMICATINTNSYNRWNDGEPISYILKQEHTPLELERFLSSLDFEYHEGYGLQELYGTVWFTNGIWMDRYEYNGSEHWDIHKYPAIPHELHNIHHIDKEPLTEEDCWNGNASHSE